ncbi:hypothetical protein ABW19_dt0207754 [Dactylella cylindrospora]|nr:hypothetical protein ABW19_dt0207754 [Dactylella cylindrospora]
MSNLRKRQGVDTKETDNAASSTGHDVNDSHQVSAPDAASNEDEPQVDVPEAGASDHSTRAKISHGKAKVKNHLQKHKKHSHNTLMFIIGGVVGILGALFFLKEQDIVQLPEFSLESIAEALPATILNEARDISKRQKDTVNYDSFAIGLRLKEEGLESHYPVVMIPGVISTGLESWGTSAKSLPYFRKRLWGSFTMMRTLMLDKALWKDISERLLDLEQGMQHYSNVPTPVGFSSSYPDFHVQILENLATLGYDPTSSYTAAYDWRLSYANLEKRVKDQYFTRLKNHIEVAKKVHKRKCILISHSMGSQVVFYFLKWVEARGEGFGNGGKTWVEDHIEAFINVSSKRIRKNFFLLPWTYPSIDIGVHARGSEGDTRRSFRRNEGYRYSSSLFIILQRKMLIRIVSPIESAPDDQANQTTSFGNFIKFKYYNQTTNETEFKNLTVGGSIDYLLESSEPWFRDQVLGSYSHGIAWSVAQAKENEQDPTKWINPLEVPLPYAPSMKIYCFYGYGKPTERSYYYKRQSLNESSLPITIDPTINIPEEDTDHGVVIGEGDGTVPLMSSGFMCSKGWKMKRFNPARIPIKSFEMLHEPQSFDIRGGPNTADHVDILGRQQLNELILRVAAGKGDSIPEKVMSNIDLYASRVDLGGMEE